jgi:hypothetical protein
MKDKEKVMQALRTAVSFSILATASAAFANVDNLSLPEPVRVPDAHVQKAWTVGIGEVTYACREKADQPGSHAWTFVVPAATLYDASKKKLASTTVAPPGKARTAPRSPANRSQWRLTRQATCRCNWSRPILPRATVP